jgi:putative tryptophan/tyrosine transport system substrate-binding protein
VLNKARKYLSLALGEAVRRREFVSLLGGAAVAYPLAVRAQPSDQLRRVAVLGDSPSTWKVWIAGFAERLRELGWIEDRTIAIEYRWSEGRPERVAEATTEFVQRKPDVIVTYGGAALVLKGATASIPIVFAIAIDPLGAGLVQNLSRPGGNITGLSLQQTESSGRRLEVLRDVVPGLHRLAIMFDGGYSSSVGENEAVQAMAHKLGLEAAPYEIRRPEDISPIFDALKRQVDALYVVGNALTESNVGQIVTLALGAKLPTSLTSANSVRAGGLMSYGPDYPAIFRRAADYVDRILRGTKLGDLPVEQPTKFDLVINLKTARALGLTIPHNLLVLADEVIE